MTNEENNIDVAQNEESILEAVAEEIDNAEEVYALSLGTELTFKDIYPISSSELSKVIMLAGSNGCGKTTLITAIYHQFLTKPFHRYYFAGSYTLQAFEERAFYNRVQSLQSSPNMKRTNVGSLDSILHLRLLDTKTNCIKNLFLSDLSGEDFNRVSGDIELAKEDFSMLYQSHILILILDGEAVSSKQCRNREIFKVAQLLRTFLDAGVLHKKAKIIVVLSKYDLINKNMETDDTLNNFVDSILNKISALPSLTSSLKLCTVAAMPEKESSISQGYGLDELLEVLFEEECFPAISAEYKSQSKSQFNLFGERVGK